MTQFGFAKDSDAPDLQQETKTNADVKQTTSTVLFLGAVAVGAVSLYRKFFRKVPKKALKRAVKFKRLVAR